MKKEPAGLKSTNCSPSPAATTTIRSNKINNKKVSNKSFCCPFACPTCQSLGGDLVKSKYEIINILSDNGDSIFSPIHEEEEERYQDNEDHRSALRNGGKVFLSADLIDSLFQQIQQKYKK
jgi:hypothetical protein